MVTLHPVEVATSRAKRTTATGSKRWTPLKSVAVRFGVFVALVMLIGCGGTATSSNSGQSTVTPASTTESPLKRPYQSRDVVPEGVEVQFGFGGAGGGWCSGVVENDQQNPESLQVRTDPKVAEIPQQVFFCLNEYDPDQVVDGEVELPDGTVQKIRVTQW